MCVRIDFCAYTSVIRYVFRMEVGDFVERYCFYSPVNKVNLVFDAGLDFLELLI